MRLCKRKAFSQYNERKRMVMCNITRQLIRLCKHKAFTHWNYSEARRTRPSKSWSLGYVSLSLGKWCYLSLSRFWIYLWFSISLINVLWCDLQSVRNTNSDLQDDGSVDKFLRQSYLHWLEALSLLRSLSSGVVMIRKLENRLQVCFSVLFYDITPFLARMVASYLKSENL